MPAITKPNQHFDATTYSGSGGTQSVTNAGSFQPDFVWIKNRTSGYSHLAYNSIVGAGTAGTNKALQPDTTNAESGANAGSTYGYMSAFNSNGFTVVQGSDATSYTNGSGQTYVAWNWKAGGTAVTNTSGTITSSVSANPTAGFSIIQFTATGATATVGHGLGVAPQMIIVKDAASVGNWAVWHTSLTSTAHYLFMNTTAAQASASAIWTGTPSSTTFGIGSWHTADRQIAYCFAPIAGYSSFGSYVGNSSADGPFLYTGFRPRWIMLKVASGQTGDWLIIDTSRDTYNVASNLLYASSAAAQDSPGGYTVDLVSNGFKFRHSSFGFNNTSGTYIYAAFAEAPFKFSNGR